mgnify:FL=1
MHVELKPHIGINLVTKKEQCHEQYLVFCGHPSKLKMVGILGWAEGSKIVFMTPVDPLSAEEIRTKVQEIIKREAEMVEHPNIDQDLVTPPQIESDLDEFNESDLT